MTLAKHKGLSDNCNLAILTPHNVTTADIPNYRIHFMPQSVKMVNIAMTPQFEFSSKCRIKSEQTPWVNNLTDWPFHLTMDSSLWSPPFNTNNMMWVFLFKWKCSWLEQSRGRFTSVSAKIIINSNSFAFQLLATELFTGGENSQLLAEKKTLRYSSQGACIFTTIILVERLCLNIKPILLIFVVYFFFCILMTCLLDKFSDIGKYDKENKLYALDLVKLMV